jgi:hypothetical protein
LHSIFHLLGSFTFVCLFLNAILTIPLLFFRNSYPQFIQLTNYTAIGAVNLAVLGLLYYKSSVTVRQSRIEFLIYYPLFVVIYLGLSVQNAIAVIQGFAGHRSAFIRTPKFAGKKENNNVYLSKKINWITLLEVCLLAYFCYGIGLSIYLADYFMLLFFLMMCWGLSILLYPTFSGLKSKDQLNSTFTYKTFSGS